MAGTENDEAGAEKKHSETFVKCATGVVYQILLPCEFSYVCHTGHCINDHLGEQHAASIRKKQAENLLAHCSTCMGCERDFKNVKILGRSKERVGGERLEAFYTKELGEKCVSDTSVALYSVESSFLCSFVY